MKYYRLLIVLCHLFIESGAQQFSLSYSFAMVTPSSGVTDPSPVPLHKGLVLSPVMALGVSPHSNAGGRFSFTQWPQGGIDGSDTYTLFTGAPSAKSYYQLRLWVSPGYSLTVNSVSFAVRRSSSGIRNFSVRCDRDDYVTDLAATTGTNTRISLLPHNIFFWKYDSVSTSSDQRGCAIHPGALCSNVTDSVTFRIYAWNAESGSGTFSIDNLNISGSVIDSLLLSGFSPGEKFSDEVSIPNPSHDGYLRINSARDLYSVEIADVYGRLIFRDVIITAQHYNCEVRLSPGTYFLRIRAGARLLCRKWVVLDN